MTLWQKPRIKIIYPTNPSNQRHWWYPLILTLPKFDWGISGSTCLLFGKLVVHHGCFNTGCLFNYKTEPSSYSFSLMVHFFVIVSLCKIEVPTKYTSKCAEFSWIFCRLFWKKYLMWIIQMENTNYYELIELGSIFTKQNVKFLLWI